MSHKFLIQLIITILSIVVVSTYVSPKFTELQARQVEIAKFKDVADKAEQFNGKLSSMINSINSLSQSELRTLKDFLPENVDPVAVVQDIESISIKTGMKPVSLALGEESESDVSSDSVQYIQGDDDSLSDEFGSNVSLADLRSYEFNVEVSGPYENFVSFLRTLENNKYPLQIVSLDISSSEGIAGVSVFNYRMTLKTFSFTKSKK